MSADRSSDTPTAVSITASTPRNPLIPATRVDIEFLSGIATTGTLRGAAKKARLKQSYACRHLERLERKVGVPLCTGTQHNLRLTDDGAYLLRIGRRYLHRLNEAVCQVAGDFCEVDDANPAALRTIRFAVDGGVWDDFVDDLARHLPTLLPVVVNAAPEISKELFERYRVDAVYTSEPFREADRLSRPTATYHVVDEPMWVGLPSDHPSAHKAVIPLRDLEEGRWIVGPGETARQALVNACWEVGFEPRIYRVVESLSMARSLLWHRAGVALFSPLSFPPGDNAGFLIRPLEDGPYQQHVLTVDPSVVPDYLARTLRERLQESYRERARGVNSEYAATLEQQAVGDVPLQRSGATESMVERNEPRDRDEALSCCASGIKSDHGDYRLEPEDVTMLRVIDESGSLNRAAPALLISQPALTRRLKRLERRLALKLLVSDYRGTALTAAGRKLLNMIAEAEREFQLAGQVLLERASRESATVRKRVPTVALSTPVSYPRLRLSSDVLHPTPAFD